MPAGAEQCALEAAEESVLNSGLCSRRAQSTLSSIPVVLCHSQCQEVAASGVVVGVASDPPFKRLPRLGPPAVGRHKAHPRPARLPARNRRTFRNSSAARYSRRWVQRRRISCQSCPRQLATSLLHPTSLWQPSQQQIPPPSLVSAFHVCIYNNITVV